jgi:hypothetical protein
LAHYFRDFSPWSIDPMILGLCEAEHHGVGSVEKEAIHLIVDRK